MFRVTLIFTATTVMLLVHLDATAAPPNVLIILTDQPFIRQESRR